jgi:cytochrome c-type biogenesis protein
MLKERALRRIPLPTGKDLVPILFYLILGGGLVAAAFFGTKLYNFYIPNIAAEKDFSLGLALIAVTGGVGAFLSPCAFGMLPAYFASFLALRGSQVEGRGTGHTVLASLRYGAATGAGMVLVGAILATLITVLGSTFAPGLRVVTAEPNEVTRAIRLAAGALLVLMAVAQLIGFRFPWVGRVAAIARLSPGQTRRPTLWFFGYGLLYLLVALPCAANVLAAPLLYAYAIGGTDLAAGTAFLFLSTMAVMAVLVALIVGLSKDELVRRLKVSGRQVQVVAAVFFLGIGATLIYADANLAFFRETFFNFPIKG